MRFPVFFLLVTAPIAPLVPAHAIQITLDFTLDEQNLNWFGGTPEGLARRASLTSAAGFLSAIIINDDWNALNSLNESFSLSDIALSSINDLDGNPINGTPSGGSYSYSINTTNRSGVAANEYIIYVGAFPFTGTSAHAKGGWDSADRRNAAGFAGTEFNTWGGRIYFDTTDDWYAGYNPGIDPTDNYGIQDPNKTPTTDITTDNWDWHTSLLKWSGFDLKTVDPAANGRPDLYGTGLHEMIHALGATDSNMSTYVGVSGNNLIGEHLMAEYGGPVPKSSTGHFAASVQSVVWDSDNIISEALLDPNSTDGARKYLTRLDAALLRDLGYQVLNSFSPADFNLDGFVNADDLTEWQLAYGMNASADADKDGDSDGADFLAWQRGLTSSMPILANAAAVPEPTTLFMLASALIFCIKGVRHLFLDGDDFFAKFG